MDYPIDNKIEHRVHIEWLFIFPIYNNSMGLQFVIMLAAYITFS